MSAVAKYHEGWLWKWTNYVNGYQKRWFTLADGVLSYYISPEETAAGCRGNVILCSAKWAQENSCNFRIEVEGAFTYYLRASDSDDCERWMKALEEMKQLKSSQSKESKESRLGLQQQLGRQALEDIILPIQESFAELQTCQNVNEKHSEAVMKSLAEISQSQELSLGDSSEPVVRYKELSESVTLFRLTSSAMVNTCSEFLKLVTKQAQEWQDEQVKQLRNVSLPRYQEDLDDGDDEYQDASEKLLIFSDGSAFGQSGSSLSVSNMSLETRKSNHSILSQSNHRKTIPMKPNYKLNLWSVLKNCIGRDISKLPVPVNFSEPISILQKLTEEFEYSELLDKAALCTDSCLQMAYVAAFSVSCYSTTAFRTGKPFNPLLGETYEFDSMDELGFRFVAEQVSHHPPMAAIHAESSKGNGHGGWEYWHQSTPSSKFRGNYLMLTPVGTVHLLFHDSGNHYTWNRVTLTVNNIILGKLWFDQSGISKIVNHTTGDTCDLKYQQYNYFDSSSFRKVTGTVIDKCNIERYSLFGTWDKEMKCRRSINSPNNQERAEACTFWRVNPLPEQAECMYNFSSLAMVLNERIDNCAPTDSRRRPDQRKMEEAQWDEANFLKLELEERQRQRRRILEEENAQRKKQRLPSRAHEPNWFKKQVCPLTRENAYVFCHEYWDAKKRQEWKKCDNIFDLTGKKLSSSLKENWALDVQANRVDGSSSSKDAKSNSTQSMLPP